MGGREDRRKRGWEGERTGVREDGRKRGREEKKAEVRGDGREGKRGRQLCLGDDSCSG